MMEPSLDAMVHELDDRGRIFAVIHTYGRAMDRMDRALLLSCFHPDAINDHGLFAGGPEAFCDWVAHYHGHAQAGHQHILTNHSCELDGDVAHTESYWMFAGLDAKDYSLSIAGGRYLDRMEKRDCVWRIAARKSVAEWGGVPTELNLPAEFSEMLRESGVTARDRSDVSYQRPLTVNPARIGINNNILPPDYEPD